jgi:hypothetical protein
VKDEAAMQRVGVPDLERTDALCPGSVFAEAGRGGFQGNRNAVGSGMTTD